MKFFPGYVSDARRQLLDAAAFRWHQTGQQQKKLMKWGDRSQLQGGVLMLEAPTPPAIAQKGKQVKQRQELLQGNVNEPSSGSQPSSGVAALVTGMLMVAPWGFLHPQSTNILYMHGQRFKLVCYHDAWQFMARCSKNAAWIT